MADIKKSVAQPPPGTLHTLNEYSPLIEATAIITSVVVALIVFGYTRRVDRKRATLEMVMKTFLDEDGRKRYDEFKAIVRKDQDVQNPFKIASLSVRTDDNEADRTVVIDQLNDYELVSLGIRRGLFDERFYKLWFHGQFTRDYRQVERLLEAIQSTHPATYCEFSALYKRWMKRKHPVKQPGKLKMAYWSLTGNLEALDIARTAMKG